MSDDWLLQVFFWSWVIVSTGLSTGMIVFYRRGWQRARHQRVLAEVACREVAAQHRRELSLRQTLEQVAKRLLQRLADLGRAGSSVLGAARAMNSASRQMNGQLQEITKQCRHAQEQQATTERLLVGTLERHTRMRDEYANCLEMAQANVAACHEANERLTRAHSVQCARGDRLAEEVAAVRDLAAAYAARLDYVTTACPSPYFAKINDTWDALPEAEREQRCAGMLERLPRVAADDARPAVVSAED